MPRWRWKVSTTWAPSPARMRPVSTNTQVSRGPMARCTSWRPPPSRLRPRARRGPGPSPTWARMASTEVSMMLSVVQSVGAPQHVDQETLQVALAAFGVADLGVELHAVEAPPAVLQGGHRAVAGRAVTTKPSGTVAMASKWLIHTVCAVGSPSVSRAARSRVAAGCGRTRPGRCGPPRRRAGRPAAGRRSRCRARARPGRRWRGRAGGAPSSCTELGTARQHDPDRPAAARPPRR